MGSSYKHYYALLVGLITLSIYWLTASGSVTTGDSGELATAILSLGISHPPGYPTFTILAYLWSFLPFDLEPIAILNLFNGPVTATGIFFFYLTVTHILSWLYPESDKHVHLISSVTSLTLALSTTVWSQGISLEVYGFHFLILNIIIYLSVRSLMHPGRSDWILLLTFIGIGLTHHLTVVLLLPAIAYLGYTQHKEGHMPWQKIWQGGLIALIIIGIAYASLWWRSSLSPVLNWGMPSSLENLWKHVSADQYSYLAFASRETALYNLKIYMNEILPEFTFVGVLISLLGFYGLYKRSERLFHFIFILFIINLVIAINYAITDINPYFLLCQIAVAVLLAVGFMVIYKLIGSGQNKIPSVWTFSFLPVFIFFSNLHDMDHRGYGDMERYYKKSILGLPPNSVLLTNEFELDISNHYYFQIIQNKRRDLTLIDIGSMISSEWFSEYLRLSHPDFVSPISSEINVHIRNINTPSIEKDILRKSAIDVFEAIIEHNFSKRPVYISHWAYSDYFRPNGPIDILGAYSLTPQQFFYQVSPKLEYVPLVKNANYGFISPKIDDAYIRNIADIIKRRSWVLRHPKFLSSFVRFREAQLIDHRIQYELKHDSLVKAHELHDSLARFFPDYILPAPILTRLENVR